MDSVTTLRVSDSVADYTLDCWAADCDPPEGVTTGRGRTRMWTGQVTREQYAEFLAQAEQQVDMWQCQRCCDSDDRADKARWNRALIAMRKQAPK